MVIAQISDTHILARTTDQAVGKRRADDLRRSVADINRQRPDIVVHTGDIVQHGQPEEYAHVREILAPLKVPLYLIPGNRDHRGALRAAFGDHTYLPANGDFLHYTVEHHAVRLVALDSIAAGDKKGVFCERRLAWLDGVLEQMADRPTILLIHHPPFDIGSHYLAGYRRPQDVRDLAAVVSRHPQVARLLCGHVHRPIHVRWAGTFATVMPSIAVDVRKGVNTACAKDSPMYHMHAMSAGARLVSSTRIVTG